MSKTVVALFRNAEDAQKALSELAEQGFNPGDISLIAHDGSGKYSKLLEDGSRERHEVGSAAGTGAAIGSAAGLMLGLAALAIPGIGPIVAAGPMAAALTGAGIGAAAGGILGSLVELGVPHSEAGYFAEGLKRGGTLLVVHCNEDEVDRAERILNRNGAQDIDEHAEEWRKSGWSGFDPHSGGGPTALKTLGVRVYDPDRSDVPDPADEDYRRHFEATFKKERNSYNDYAAAYRFGATVGKNPRYQVFDWDEIESDLRERWEEDQPGTWEKLKDAVRFGWDHVRGRA
jgi:hypothetical protein